MAERVLSARPLDAQHLNLDNLEVKDTDPKAPDAPFKDATYEAVKFDGAPKVRELEGRVLSIAQRFWDGVRVNPIPVKNIQPTALGLLHDSAEAKAILEKIGPTKKEDSLLIAEFDSLKKIINEDQQKRNERATSSLMEKAAKQYSEAADKLIELGREQMQKTINKLTAHEERQRMSLAQLFVKERKNGKDVYKTFKSNDGKEISAQVVERFHRELYELLRARQSEIVEQVKERYRKDEEEITARFNGAMQISCATMAENRKRKLLAENDGTAFNPVPFYEYSPETGPHDFAHRWYEENKDKAHKTFFKINSKDLDAPIFLAGSIYPLTENKEHVGWQMDVFGPVTAKAIKDFILDAVGKGCTRFDISGLILPKEEKRKIALQIIKLTGDPNSVEGYHDSKLKGEGMKKNHAFREKLGLKKEPSQLQNRVPISKELHTPKPVKDTDPDLSLSAKPMSQTTPPADLSARPIAAPPPNSMLGAIAQPGGQVPVPGGGLFHQPQPNQQPEQPNNPNQPNIPNGPRL